MVYSQTWIRGKRIIFPTVINMYLGFRLYNFETTLLTVLVYAYTYKSDQKFLMMKFLAQPIQDASLTRLHKQLLITFLPILIFFPLFPTAKQICGTLVFMHTYTPFDSACVYNYK